MNLSETSGDISYIILKNCKTIVDTSRLEEILNFGTWTIDGKYVCTMKRHESGKRKKVLLHQYILNFPVNMCDHINGNPLDNRHSNLREVSSKQNQQNTQKCASDNTSGIKNVYWRSERNKWECRLSENNGGKRHDLFRKLCSTRSEAKAYSLEARKKFYPFSKEANGLNLNLHSRLFESNVNGPGNRYVFWVQGCPHACKSCFNPDTWGFKKNHQVSTVDLAIEILRSNSDGLTISGGEPMSQPDALLELLKLLHDSEKNLLGLPKGIICFTGFLIEELVGAAAECLEYIDLLIDGRYVEQLRYTSGLAGSSNQRFHFSSLPGRGESRLQRSEILIDQAVEVHIDDIDPSIIRVTGFPSIDRTFLKRHGLRVESED